MGLLRPVSMWKYAMFLLCSTGGVAMVTWFSTQSPQQVVVETPPDVAALRALEVRVQKAARQVLPATVAVEIPDGGYCSGVIITADGLVLSQFHVSHRLESNGKLPYRSRLPGQRSSVILHDGRKLEAELLGSDQSFDLSLLRILDPGPHPHTPLGHPPALKLGEWVLKLGHPTGYHVGRPPVVRLGRVLYSHPDLFVTDCYTTGGDSGGPFFDLDGRLVGIFHDGQVPKPLLDTLRVIGPPVATVGWEYRNGKYVGDRFGGVDGPRALYRLGPYSGLTNRTIHRHIESMKRREQKDYDQNVAVKFHQSHTTQRKVLPQSEWTQGGNTARPYHSVIAGTSHSVVTVLDPSGERTRRGTLIDSDGWIVTMARALPAEPQCLLHDGRTVVAKVMNINEPENLAYLKVAENNLIPVKLATSPLKAAGLFVMGVGVDDGSSGIGIVSVPPLQTANPSDSKDQTANDRSALFELDLPIDTRPQFGSPVLNLEGETVGVIISRTQYGCKAVTAEHLQHTFEQLKAQQR